jgi:tetratricopeptide (TPR) repeat protein
MVDHSADHGGTPWLGWVDTAALLNQARAYELAGSFRHADAAYNALIVAATRQQDHPTLAAAFRHRAVLAHQAGDTARARSALQQSYAVATMIGDRRLTAETLNTLGGIELETRNLTAAETALLEAEKLAAQEPEILARVEQNLGIVANIRGQHDDAEKHYRKSLAAYEALPDRHGSALAHHNLGMLAADREAFVEAVDHFDACEVLAEASHDAHLVALCLLNRAEVLLAMGRTEQARRDAASAERGFEALGAHFNAADVHRMIALCDWADERLGQAETRLKQARELAKMTGARLTAAETARDLGRLYRQTGRMKEAHGALWEAIQGFEGLGATADADATRRELGKLALAGSAR